MIPFQNWSQGQSPYSVSQGPTWSPTLLIPYSSDPSPYFLLRLQPCSLLADPQIDLHTPCCQGTFVFTIPLLRHFPHRYPLGWLPHLLQVFAQMPSFRLIFHLKSYPPTQHASSPLPCIFFPQSIYHTMYLLFLVAVIYLLLLECKALWREGVFVSFLRCDIPAVLRPQWVFSEYLVNEREAYALCTRSPTFHLLMIHLTKLLVYFCYEGHFK